MLCEVDNNAWTTSELLHYRDYYGSVSNSRYAGWGKRLPCDQCYLLREQRQLKPVAKQVVACPTPCQNE